MSRFDVLHMIKRRAEASGLPLFHLLPQLSCRRQLPLSARTGARWSILRPSRMTNRRESPRSSIASARNSRSRKSRESESKVLHEALFDWNFRFEFLHDIHRLVPDQHQRRKVALWGLSIVVVVSHCSSRRRARVECLDAWQDMAVEIRRDKTALRIDEQGWKIKRFKSF
jgi:hypothetical protein